MCRWPQPNPALASCAVLYINGCFIFTVNTVGYILALQVFIVQYIKALAAVGRGSSIICILVVLHLSHVSCVVLVITSLANVN